MNMLDRFGTNPTQLLGVLSFAAATIACLSALRRSGSRDRRIWKVLALTNGMLLIETALGLRFRILELARASLKAEGLYNQMHGEVQGIVVVSIAAIALIFATLFLLRSQVAGGAVRVAACMTIANMAVFAVEMVSLHELYAVFYRPVGPVALIGWLWAITAAGISLAAFLG
jgi:predicted membrane-bound spermidine synthase